MRRWIVLLVLSCGNISRADESLEAQRHSTRGRRCADALQYERAIEEYGLAYEGDGKAVRLNDMAEIYGQMAAMADNPIEALKSKRRALKLYETFLVRAPNNDSELEPFRKTAAARVEPLRQEINELAARLVEREGSLKTLNDKMDQVLAELRALRELLLRRERGAAPTGSLHPIDLRR